MTLIELKKQLHEKLEGENDENILAKVSALLNHKDHVFMIPEHMKEGIRKGVEDGKNGRVHSQEDFDKKYEEWLKE
jgi:hypothetical protein